MIFAIMKSIKNKAFILLAFNFAKVQARPAVSQVLQNQDMVVVASVAMGVLVMGRWISAVFDDYESKFRGVKADISRLKKQLTAKNENVFTLNECDKVRNELGNFCDHEREVEYTFCKNYGHGSITLKILSENKAESETLFTIVHTVPTHGSPTITITKIDPVHDLHVPYVLELNAADIDYEISRAYEIIKFTDAVRSSLKKLVQEIRARVLVK